MGGSGCLELGLGEHLAGEVEQLTHGERPRKEANPGAIEVAGSSFRDAGN
jgi:hypothetical protein